MSEMQALEFVRQYVAGEPVTAETHQAFRHWLMNHSDAEIEEWLQQFQQLVRQQQIADTPDPAWTERLLQRIEREETVPVVQLPVRRRSWIWMAAAAVVLVLITGTVFYFSREARLPVTAGDIKKRYKNDLPPGGDHASLTLADGSIILLDAQQNGAVATQGAVSIIKSDSGRLLYRMLPAEIASSDSKGHANDNAVITYNTLNTPKGGQFQIELPDGSRVWMNAASSLRFPTAFNGKERRVQLSGEAYFEVAKTTSHQAMPFIVEMNNFQVKVLGTHFNVSAYTNEAMHKVTLLQGRVSVEQGARHQIMTPGQQASFFNSSFSVADGDTEEAVAWKNGLFQFTNTPLTQVLHQLERWYNINITYDSIPEKHFYGIISRNSSLSEVLSMLEVTGGVKFTIEGNSVKVLR